MQMKSFWFIAFLFSTGLIFGQIRVKQPVQELGDVFEDGGKVRVTFNLENPYFSDTIRILKIETSCGCTAVLMKDSLILPRSTVGIDVFYDPKDRLGLFVKSVELTTRTGNRERNQLFLKITGNVVSTNYNHKVIKSELVDYAVAPIYFYPITVYDTSYLDFNFITDFVNDLTYEIDFYQFTTMGIQVEIPEFADLERVEYLINFARKKVIREFEKRGFPTYVLFFEEPVFVRSNELPPWAIASVRLYSSNFDAGDAGSTKIVINSTSEIQETKLLLNYERFGMPEIAEIIDTINFESIESKLFLAGEIVLNGQLNLPWKKDDAFRQKLAKELMIGIKKKIKETTGATGKQITVNIDFKGIHPSDKYQFLLWDAEDLEAFDTVKIDEKRDVLTPPLLPTYQHYYQHSPFLDTLSPGFIHFWHHLKIQAKAGEKVRILVVSSRSRKLLEELVQPQIYADFLQSKMQRETGASIEFILKSIIRGPISERLYEEVEYKEQQFNYISLIPLLNLREDVKVTTPNPYMVNFDFYFKGIDTEGLGFQQFAKYLADEVLKEGYVALRIESSISEVPVDELKTNLEMAYARLFESQKRLSAAMERKLIDPNRIIFLDERVVQQGPGYDGSMPILTYRKYHYIRLIPEKFLTKE